MPSDLQYMTEENVEELGAPESLRNRACGFNLRADIRLNMQPCMKCRPFVYNSWRDDTHREEALPGRPASAEW